jgi:dihydrofolate synthase/folylpolyglutamate synthase
MGRWQQLQSNPPLVCDTGHNVAGITYVVNQLLQQKYKTLHIVIGMVNDKDVNGVLALLPQNAKYYFTQASVTRALPSTELQQLANKHGLEGECYENVASAVMSAQKNSLPEDFIFVGGSNFIVADLLSNRDTLNLY